MSPLRRRHLSCSSSSSGSLGSLKKGTKVTSSMRLMNALRRPSLSSFMEKTQSLGRYSGGKVKSTVTSPTNQNVDEEEMTTQPGTSAVPTTSSSSTMKKALRDSFRAAKNLLPSSNKLSKSDAGRKEITSSSTLSLTDDANESTGSVTINHSPNSSPKATIRGLGTGVKVAKKEQSNLRSFLSRSKSNLAKSFETISDEPNKARSSVSEEGKDVTAAGVTSKSLTDKVPKKTKDQLKKEKKEAEKEKAIASGEKPSPKKVSLVKSIKSKIRSRSKDRKEKTMSAEGKSVSGKLNF
jgi:hypothetical protein